MAGAADAPPSRPSADDRRRPVLRAAVRGTLDALAVASLWLLFAGRWAGEELAAAAAVGVLGALVGAAVRHVAEEAPTPVRHHLRAVVPAYGRALADAWRVTLLLLRPPVGRLPAGRLRRVPFAPGGDEPRDRGRRLAVTLATTLSPASYVVGFDADRDEALIHELLPRDGGPIDARLREEAP